MKIEHKLIISYIGIILITSLLWMYFKKQDQIQYQKQAKIQEGFNFNDIVVKPIKKSFNDGIVKPLKNAAEDTIKKPLQTFLNFFKDIQDAFHAMSVASNDLDKALNFLFTQGAYDFADLSKTTWDVTETTYKHVLTSTISVWNCVTKVWQNRTYCFGIYAFTLIGYTFYYLFVGLPVYLIDLLSGGFLNVQSTIDAMFDILQFTIMDIFGDTVTLIHNRCFSCDIIPIPKISAAPIIDSANKMKYDFNNDIPNKFYNLRADFNSIGHYLGKAFSGNP